MPAECIECGDDVTDKNSARNFRDRCMDCIEAEAVSTRHIDQCASDDCSVCQSYRNDPEVGRV